ncbi:MAG: hypothetical protein AAGG75_28695 [Bacteroidota bacterium]
MSISTTLHLRLNKYLAGANLAEDAGVKTNIYARPVGPQETRRRQKSVYNISIPVGTGTDYRSVNLEPGRYIVECILPSGEIITEEVKVEANQPNYLALVASPSPRENLSWQSYSGNIRWQQAQQLKSEGPKRSMKRSVRPKFDQFFNLEGDFDAKEFSEETLGKNANPVWEDLLKRFLDPEETDGQSKLNKTIDMMDDLLLEGLVGFPPETFRNPYEGPKQQWRMVENLIGDQALSVLDFWMKLSQEVRLRPNPEGPYWYNPSYTEDEVNLFRMSPILPAFLDYKLLWTPAGAELIILPTAWKKVKTDEFAVVEVMVDTLDAEQQFRASITVQDPTLSSALAYLTAGSLPTARQMLPEARHMLAGKIKNPYAAAAGGYVLMETLEPGAEEVWMNWIDNLYNWFQWLPDGAVLKGWLLLHQGAYDEAHTTFVEAYERGIPLYSLGLKKLLEGLKLFASEDTATMDLQKRVRRVAWRTNMQQIFTIIQLGLPRRSKSVSAAE